MKRAKSIRTIASLATLAGLSLSAHAAITGQWDFDTDLSARIGLPIGILEGGGGPVEAGTAFGTTTSFGIPGMVLMENAGRGAVEMFLRKFGHLSEQPPIQQKVGIIAGRGNNGGDGFVIGRYLMEKGIPTTIFLLSFQAIVAFFYFLKNCFNIVGYVHVDEIDCWHQFQ